RAGDPIVAFGVPDQLLELVAPGVGALDRPPAAGLDWGGFALGGDLAGHATSSEFGPGLGAVIASVQVDRGRLWQRPEPGQGVQGRAEHRRVVAIGAGGHGAQRDAAGLGYRGALAALLAPVDRLRPA